MGELFTIDEIDEYLREEVKATGGAPYYSDAAPPSPMRRSNHEQLYSARIRSGCRHRP